MSKKNSKKKRWSNLEKYWFRKRWTAFVLIVIVYTLIGKFIPKIIEKLAEHTNQIAANIIIFTLVFTIVWTMIDLIDKRTVKNDKK